MEYKQLYSLVLDDELGWEHLISSIIREENMDPMDIDLIEITDRFVSTLASVKNIDFRFGGKFVYTAAILLKMKSDSVVDDIMNKHAKKADDGNSKYVRAIPYDISVTPKLPLVRNRKITLTELISAIRSAIKSGIKPNINFEIKQREIRLEDVIPLLLQRLLRMFREKESVSFSELLIKKDKKDYIFTFLPLLFLSNDGKVDLKQDAPFEEIYVWNKRIH